MEPIEPLAYGRDDADRDPPQLHKRRTRNRHQFRRALAHFRSRCQRWVRTRAWGVTPQPFTVSQPGHVSPVGDAHCRVGDGRAREMRQRTGASLLTRRERDVTALIAQGFTNRQISERLAISPGTVANYVENILHQLDFNRQAQIAVWAVEHGLHQGRPSPRD